MQPSTIHAPCGTCGTYATARRGYRCRCVSRRAAYAEGRQWADSVARNVPNTGISGSTLAYASSDLARAKVADDDEQRAFCLGYMRRVREHYAARGLNPAKMRGRA
jgi:hypothetical protein